MALSLVIVILVLCHVMAELNEKLPPPSLLCHAVQCRQCVQYSTVQHSTAQYRAGEGRDGWYRLEPVPSLLQCPNTDAHTTVADIMTR